MSSDAPKPAKKRAALINVSTETRKMAAANAPEPVAAAEPKAPEPVAEAEKETPAETTPTVKKKSAKKALIRTIPKIKEARRILTQVTKKMGEILGVATTKKRMEGISLEEVEKRSRESVKKVYATYDRIEEKYSKLAAEQDDDEYNAFNMHSDGTTSINRKRKVSTEVTPQKKPRTKQSATIALPVRTQAPPSVVQPMSADAKREKLMAFQQKFKNKYKFVSSTPTKTKAPRVKKVSSKPRVKREPKMKKTAEQRKAAAAEKRAIKRAAVLLARSKKLNPEARKAAAPANSEYARLLAKSRM